MLQLENPTHGAPMHRLPDLDVHEENGELVLKAEFPGIQFGDVDVREVRIPMPPLPDGEAWLPEEIAY
jgi:HSP20 family molecular chaperone IbpA